MKDFFSKCEKFFTFITSNRMAWSAINDKFEEW